MRTIDFSIQTTKKGNLHMGKLLSGLLLLAGINAMPAQAMNLVMPETSEGGNFEISWTDAKGGTGFADVVVEEKVNDKFEVIYSYTNGPSANTYRVQGKAPGTYTYRITECIETTDCNKAIEKTVVVTAPKP